MTENCLIINFQLGNETKAQPILKYRRLANTVHKPTRVPGSVGIDLPVAFHYNIEPNTFQILQTNIAVEIPPGHFGLIKERSGYAYEYCMKVYGGIIDPDYR